MKVLTTIDLLALPSLKTPPTGHVGFGAKSDGLYQKIGTVETKLSIDGHTHTIANITGLQGALDLKATPSDIDAAINGIEIGGRNFVQRSNEFNQGSGASGITPSLTAEGYLQVVTTSGNGNWLSSWAKSTAGIENNFAEGDDFTVSITIRRVSGTGKPTIYIKSGMGYYNLTGDLGTSFTRLHYSGTWKKANSISPHLGWSGTNGTFIIKDWKIEKGNKPTDWTPAPEDQVSDWSVTDVNSFAFIKNKPTQLSQFTDNIGVASHIANKANPHAVTKSQVGLGNVDNVKQATKSEFDTHTGNTTVHITSTERTNWNDANSKKHTHGNKSVIDALTQGHIDVLSKLSIDANGNLKIDTNAYSTGELSAYGAGTGGGGASYNRLDAWIDYDSTKSGWVLSALLGVDLNNRLSNVESGSATSITTTGSGNAITSVSKSGNTLTFAKGSTFSLSTHNHDTVYKPIGYVPSWSEITGKPSTFTPSAHTHSISDITGLQGALDGKQTTIPTGTTSQYWRGDKTWQTLNTSVVPEGTNLYFTNARVKAYGDTLYSPLGHTHTIAQITGLQGALDSKATQSDISTAVNELEIGGRNLLRNSLVVTDRTYPSSDYVDIFNRVSTIPLIEDEYVLSFEAKSTISGDTIRCYFYNPNTTTRGESSLGGITTYVDGNISLVITNEWKKYWIKYTQSATTTVKHVIVGRLFAGAGSGTVSIRNVQLEAGNKPTDCAPAPEDQVSDWNVTDVNSFAFIKNKPTLLSQFTDNIGVASHIANKANPHNVTTAQIGAVDLTTNQTIGGNKSFTGNVTAPTFVGALSGNASSATTSNRLNRLGDNRNSFRPSAIAGGSLIATFSTQGALANQVNDSDYSDVIAINSYTDSSAGRVNALSFDKNSFRINHFMGAFGASSWDGFKTIAYLTDNVASATKLQTARTIAGVSFDGTANIDIPFANLASKPTTLSGYGITDGVFTRKTITGNIDSDYGEGFTTFDPVPSGTLPITSPNIRTINIGNNFARRTQIAFPYNLDAMYFRRRTNTVWAEWREVYHTGNLSPVTTNTTQTITGAKTFSTLLTASAGVNTPKVDFGNGFTIEPSGTELVFKYNGVIKQRMLSDGSIVATGELTAYVAAT